MAYKIYNPDPVGYTLKVGGNTVIVLPANGFAIVNSLAGIAGTYPTFEITKVDDKDLSDYRRDLAKAKKEAEKKAQEKAKRLDDLAKEEAELSKKKRKKRAEAKPKVDNTALLEEEALIEQVKATMVTDTTISQPESKVVKKPKKAKKKGK